MSGAAKSPCDLLIRDCVAAGPDFSFYPHSSIAIRGGRIVGIGPRGTVEECFDPAEILPGENKLALPGLIDAHTHISQQLMRGMLADEYPVLYLRFNLPYENRLGAEEMRCCAKLACLEMIKSGITCFADAGADFLEETAPIIAESGLRAALTRPASDTGDQLPPGRRDTAESAVRKAEDLFRQLDGAADGRLRFWFQFRSVATCSAALIRSMAELARSRGTGLHTHVGEYPEANLSCLRATGLREIEYLDSLGVLGPNFLAAHCIQISDGDIKLLRDRGVKVVHCPRSNLGKGITKTPQLLGEGVSVAFGTDGTAHGGLNLFKEMSAFRHAQLAHWGVPYCDYRVMPSRTLLEIVCRGGAAALQAAGELGSLEVGKRADLILLKLDEPHLRPTHRLLNTLADSVEAGDVKDSIVDGKILMRDRRVLTLDEGAVLAEGERLNERIAAANGWSGVKENE